VRRTTAVVGGCVLLAVFVVLSLNLRIDGNIATFLPSGDREMASYVDTLERFGVAEMIYVDVAAEDPDTLHEAAAVVETHLRASPLVGEVMGGADDVELVRVAEVVRSHAAQLLPVSAYPQLEARLDPDDMADRMEMHYERLLSPAGSSYQPFFQSDPLEIGAFVLEEVLGSTTLTGARIERRRLVSADGRHALVLGIPHARMGDEKAAEELMALLEEATEAAPEGATITWVSGHRFWLSNARTVRADLGRVSTVGMLLVFLVVFIGFRGFRILSLSLLAVVAATFTAGAVAWLLYGALSGIAISFAAALSGITVDYVIHLHPAPRRGETRLASVRRVFLESGPTVLIGAVTSAAAFLMLYFSPVKAHAQLGVASAAGVLGALVFALVLGPLIASHGEDSEPTEKSLRPTLLERATIAFFRTVLARPRAAFAVAAGLTIASLFVLPYTEFESELNRFQSKDADTVAAERAFEAAWGNLMDQATLVVPGPDVETVALRTERLLAELEPLGGREFKAASSFAHILPSLQVQHRRLEAWRAFWSEERVEGVRRDLAAAAEPFDIVASSFEPFLESLRETPADLAPATFEGTPLGSILHRHLSIQGDDVEGLIALQGAREPGGAGVNWPDVVKEAVPETRVLTLGGLSHAIVEAARTQLSSLAGPSLLVVALLLFVYYGRVLPSLTGVLPLVGGLAVTTATLTLLGVPLSMINVPVAVPVFGLGVDYAVFLQDAIRDAPSDPDLAADTIGMRSAAILGVSLTTLAGGGAMLLANHPAIFAVGLTMVLGVGSTLVLSWLAVPLLARGGRAD